MWFFTFFPSRLPPLGTSLFDHFVGPKQHRQRNRHADLLRGFEIDDSRLRGYSAHMKSNHQRVLKEALGLPPEARAALAGYLLDSLDDSIDEDAESAWSEEIARRIDDLDRGRVKTVPWSVARRQILGRSGGRSKR